MKKSRKLLALLMALAMVFALAACGTDASTPTTSPTEASAEPEPSAEPSEAAGEILALDPDLSLTQHRNLKKFLEASRKEELENIGI